MAFREVFPYPICESTQDRANFHRWDPGSGRDPLGSVGSVEKGRENSVLQPGQTQEEHEVLRQTRRHLKRGWLLSEIHVAAQGDADTCLREDPQCLPPDEPREPPRMLAQVVSVGWLTAQPQHHVLHDVVSVVRLQGPRRKPQGERQELARLVLAQLPPLIVWGRGTRGPGTMPRGLSHVPLPAAVPRCSGG